MRKNPHLYMKIKRTITIFFDYIFNFRNDKVSYKDIGNYNALSY